MFQALKLQDLYEQSVLAERELRYKTIKYHKPLYTSAGKKDETGPRPCLAASNTGHLWQFGVTVVPRYFYLPSLSQQLGYSAYVS